MIIILSLLILLIFFIFILKNIIILLYYTDILYYIDRISKICYDKDDKIEEKYDFSILKDIIVPLEKIDNNESDEALNIRKDTKNAKILANPIAKDLYFFISNDSNGSNDSNDSNGSKAIIYDYYNTYGGILLGIFIFIFGLVLTAIYYKKLNGNNGNNVYFFIMIYVLYLIAYIIIFSIMSDKLKRYNDNINEKTYKDSTSIKNDFEELKKLVYAYLFLAFSIILVIMISYKNLYGDFYFYREYAITVVGLFIFYIFYVAYNEFIV